MSFHQECSSLLRFVGPDSEEKVGEELLGCHSLKDVQNMRHDITDRFTRTGLCKLRVQDSCRDTLLGMLQDKGALFV